MGVGFSRGVHDEGGLVDAERDEWIFLHLLIRNFFKQGFACEAGVVKVGVEFMGA